MTPDTHPIPAIEEAEQRRTRALVARDMAELDRLHDASLLYVHGSGGAEPRAQYLERVANGYYVYRSLTPLRRATRRFGAVALVDGDIQIEVVSGGVLKNFLSRYLQVWIEQPEGWKLASVQSTAVAQPAAAK